MKELTTREIAAVKRQFKNSLPAMKKIESIDQKIAKLQEERTIQQAILDGGEAGIMAMTGGFRSIDLITCTYEPQFNEDGTPKMDKEGKYQVKNQVLTFHAPVEVPPIEDFDTDSEAKVDEVETTATDAAFNPLNGLE
jgi:hypothetical protein